MITNLTDLFTEFTTNEKFKDIQDDMSSLLALFKDNFWDESVITFDIKNHMSAYIQDRTLKEFRESYPSEAQFFINEAEIEIELSVRLSLFKRDIDLWTKMSPLYDNYFKLAFSNCSDCGHVVHLTFDLNKKVITIPEGLVDKVIDCPISSNDELVFSVDVDVPSGTLVFANDLRKVFTKDEQDKIEKYYGHNRLSSFLGLKNESTAYAIHNMFFGYVGNRATEVVKDSDDNLIVSDPYDYAEFYEFDEDFSFEENDDFNYQGSICTDLWWFCAMDLDFLKAKSSENGFKLDSIDHFLVDVEPGKYRLTIYTSSRSGNYPNLAEFKKL